jgi:hypothetical protein
MDFSEQQAKFGGIEIGEGRKPQVAQKKKRGGIGGFLEGIARAAVEPASFALNNAIINPIKEEAASFTGNKVALRNARREGNREIGLGDEGKDLAGGLKKVAGNSAQLLLGAAAPGAGSTIKGAATIGAGTGAGSALAQDDSTLSDVLTGGVIGGATGGALKGVSSLAGKVGSGVGSGKTAQALTESGSGLKVGNAVGDIDRLAEQASFMQKYTGTPRKQLQLMAKDMGVLGKEVDDILTKTPVKIDGNAINTRLQNAITDLTDERFIDLDLTNPSVQKIVDRYGAKFAEATDAKAVNDLVKTFNKTATRAQTKLFDPKAGVLTAQEQAALALKRAGDDVLSEIPEIAPLKKQMAQIFEANPQVAKASERGISSPLLGGVKVKSPMQGLMGAQSKAGGFLGRLSGGGSAGIVDDVAEEIASGGGRIPVKFLDDAEFTNPGRPVTTTSQKVMMNPTVGELADTVGQPGVRGELGKYRQLNTSTNSTEIPVVRTTRTNTQIPVSTGSKYSQAIQELPEVAAPVAPAVRENLNLAGPASNFLGRMTRQGATAQAGLPGQVQQDTAEPIEDPANYRETDPGFQLLAQEQEAQQEDNNPFSAANAQATVQDILARGGTLKDVSEYMGIVSAMQKLNGEGAKKPLNASQNKEKNNAISAIKDIQGMRDALKKDSSASFKSSLPGGSLTQRLTGTSGYATARKNVVDSIARLRSGAAITEDEAKRYNAMLPNSFDDAEAASAKLDRLEELLYSFTYPEGGSSAGTEEILGTLGY